MPAMLAAAVFALACAALLHLMIQGDLRADARWVVEATDAYLDEVAAELAAAMLQPQATCAALRSRSGALPASSGQIQRLLADGPRLAALCPPGTSMAPPAVAPADKASVDSALALGRLAVRGWPGRADTLLAELVLPDGRALGARVDASRLLELARGRVSETHGGIRLIWSSGAHWPMAGAAGTPASTGQTFGTELASSHHPYVAGVAIGHAGLWYRYGAWLPLIALGAGAAALAATGIARRRHQSLDAPEAQLRKAIERGELEGHLQPIIDLSSGDCVGAEMLMRWRHPRHGLLAPARFLGEAKACGLLWPMTEACFRDVAARLDACPSLPEGFMLCVNFGATELALDGDSDRFAALARPGGRRWYTVIELPERDAREPAMAARLTALQDMGFLIALDDFGTAHSGTRWLERLSVDLVKIDMSIVSTIGTDSVTRPVLDAIIALARDTGVKLIAEGVEHPHQTSHLRRQGVTYAQGYVFSAPVPAAEFVERWLDTQESDEDPSQARPVASGARPINTSS